MKTLVVGAGALGGYFGACLHRAGRDVSFLVRAGRRAQLAENGLGVTSGAGRFTVTRRTVVAGGIAEPADLVLVTVKSYGLDAAMEDFAPAVGPDTVIVPVLNGLAHVDALSARFGAERVLGGMALISAVLDGEGHVALPMAFAELTFGELGGGASERVRRIEALFEGAGARARASGTIMLDMWEKYAFLAGGAAVNCLIRTSVGDMLAVPGGGDLLPRACQETRSVAVASGYAPRQAYVERILGIYATAGSPLKSSMLRDIEQGRQTEGEHVLGDMQARARRFGLATPLLDLACVNVRAYEFERARLAAGAGKQGT